jgi:phosphoglycerate dehydrogenase-like enzyme
MTHKVLVTDSLFILPEHVSRLAASGFEVSRLDKVKATEDELVAAIEGCSGYILGGIEEVTARVIEAAAHLEAICFTGSGYAEFIPAHQIATRKGIAITAARGANAPDVAEFTFGMMLEMVRHFPLLRTRNNFKGNSFFTARRLRGQTIGVIGYGRIGMEFANLCKAVGMNVIACSRGPQEGAAVELVSKDELLRRSDVISVHVSKTHGTNVITAEDVQRLKPGTVVLNAAFPEAVDCDSLLGRVRKKEIRAAFDAMPTGDLDGIDPDFLTYSNAQAGFNTAEAIQDTSDRCTASMIHLLTTGDDVDVVNPEFKQNRVR